MLRARRPGAGPRPGSRPASRRESVFISIPTKLSAYKVSARRLSRLGNSRHLHRDTVREKRGRLAYQLARPAPPSAGNIPTGGN
eukprot:scaffold99105_cov60-Phaeocystis_antarctica.AAC.16